MKYNFEDEFTYENENENENENEKIVTTQSFFYEIYNFYFF